MTESLYFAGADATLTVKDKATTPVPTTVGACDGWSFEVTWQRNDKYSADSIFLRAAAKYQLEVAVKMKFYAANPLITAGTWWLFQSLRGGGASGKDKNNDVVSIGNIADTSACTLFDISGTVEPFSNNSGVVEFGVTAEDAVVTSFPFAAKENEWMAFEVTADAADVVYTNPT